MTAETQQLFSLNIELGNEEMQTVTQLAAALEAVAQRLRDTDPYDHALIEDTGDDRGIVRDINGNTVGHWEITL